MAEQGHTKLSAGVYVYRGHRITRDNSVSAGRWVICSHIAGAYCRLEDAKIAIDHYYQQRGKTSTTVLPTQGRTHAELPADWRATISDAIEVLEDRFCAGTASRLQELLDQAKDVM